jgi:hypothetical protein
MNRSPFTSSPPSQPLPYRYLGRGSGERPVKLQIIIALVAGLIIFAVPLYLWRRPRPESIPSADAAVVDAGAPIVSPIVAFDAGPAGGITLSPFSTMKCEKPGPGKTPPERCDHVTTLEDALARAIRERPDCAPASKTAYTVSYVMATDFRRKKLNLFTGKSSSLKREKSKELLRCVKAAMPALDWNAISHQYTRYQVNVSATYPPRDTF